MSKWVAHVKEYAKKHNVSYKEALSKAGATYKKKGSGECNEVQPRTLKEKFKGYTTNKKIGETRKDYQERMVRQFGDLCKNKNEKKGQGASNCEKQLCHLNINSEGDAVRFDKSKSGKNKNKYQNCVDASRTSGKYCKQLKEERLAKEEKKGKQGLDRLSDKQESWVEKIIRTLSGGGRITSSYKKAISEMSESDRKKILRELKKMNKK